MSLPTSIATVPFKRLGSGAQSRGASLICIAGSGEAGKSRLAAACVRAAPDWFGTRAAYIAIDPESASLSSILPQDQANLEVIGLDLGRDVYEQVKAVYNHNWAAEGITTIITDTASVLTQAMLAQFAASGKFAGSRGDQHINIGSGENLPMPADYQAVNTLFMSLLRRQQASGLNHLTLFHDQEVRPEPGQPGDPIGGPATVGKASIRTIINWYNTALHLVKRTKRRVDLTKPVEYERVVHTTGHGIWQAKLRVNDKSREVPEILMDYDPASVWTTLNTIINAKDAPAHA